MKLRDLSDRALSELGAFAITAGAGTPRAMAPKLWGWIADSVAAEQSRRRGEDAMAAQPTLPAMTADELLDGVMTVIAASDAHGGRLAAFAAEAHGYSLTGEERVLAAELRGLFESLASGLLGMADAEAEPVH